MIVKIFVLFVIFQLAGCSLLPDFLYRIDVQQGNVVTQEMVDTLRPGMTKSQVRFVMGSPLIVDAFRENRWDYVYLQREKGDLVEQMRLTIFFEDERLVRIENYMPFSIDMPEPEPEPELEPELELEEETEAEAEAEIEAEQESNESEIEQEMTQPEAKE